MIKKLIALLVIMLIFCTLAFAQETSSPQMSNIPLLNTFFENATIVDNPYVVGGVDMGSYDAFSTFKIGAKGGIPFGKNMQIGAQLDYVNFSYDSDVIDSQSGISDLLVVARNNWMMEKFLLTAGGKVTLPIGSEDVGAGNMDFGAFGSIRYPMSDMITLNGTLGLDFIEMGDDRETSLMLNFGSTYMINDKINALGELTMKTEFDFTQLMGGVDYNLSDKGRVRAGLGLGLDDGAPDLQLRAAYIMNIM